MQSGAPVRMRHRLVSAATVPMLNTVKPDLSCSTRMPLSCGAGRARTNVYLTEPASAVFGIRTHLWLGVVRALACHVTTAFNAVHAVQRT